MNIPQHFVSDKRFGFLIEDDVPTMLHAITQCTEMLTIERSYS
jgi:hypothetical protein